MCSSTNTNIVIRADGTQLLWRSGLLEHKYMCSNTNTNIVIRADGTQILWRSGLLEHKHMCSNTNKIIVIRAAGTHILWRSGLLELKYCDHGCWNTNTVVIRAAGTQILWWSGLLEHKYCGDQGCWSTNTVVIRAAGTHTVVIRAVLTWTSLLTLRIGRLFSLLTRRMLILPSCLGSANVSFYVFFFVIPSSPILPRRCFRLYV
jgi:hypothetical protein